MCAPNAPPAPDYTQAAREQGAANVETARVQGKLSNPNVINPYGTQTVSYGTFDQPGYDAAMAQYQQALQAWNAGGGGGVRLGGRTPGVIRGPAPIAPTQWQFTANPDTPTLVQKFSPEQQALYDEANKAKLSLSQLATRGAGVAGDVVGKNLDLSGLPAAPTSGGVNQRVIDAMMGRVNEDYLKKQDALRSTLIAQGLPIGSKGYGDQMQLLQRGQNDAAQQAVLAGYQQGTTEFGLDTQARRNALAELLQERGTPLNEIIGMMSGSQVQNPFAVPAFSGSQPIAPAPLFGATQQAGNYAADLYNAQAAQAGSQQQGLFGLGGAGLMAAGMAFSDRRLKSNIRRIWTHPLGIGWYEYDISGWRQQGVMADELISVRPDAVFLMQSGYLAVDYGRM